MGGTAVDWRIKMDEYSRHNRIESWE